MESITSDSAYIKRLRQQAIAMTNVASSLAAAFSEEESRLLRMNQVSRLGTLRSMVSQQVEEEKIRERSASYANTKAKVTASFAKLVAGITIKIAAADKQWQAFGDCMLKNPGRKERPFGTVLVCIGPKGLPDDIRVVSVSRLARESDKEEFEVISEIRKRGYLLFTEEGFSLLIDGLIIDVHEGRLTFPISVERLSRIAAMTKHSPPQ